MMTEDESATQRVIGGVDTHKDVHVVAVLDELGRLLDTQRRLPRPRRVIAGSPRGCAVMVRSSRSVSRAPVRGVRDSHGSCGPGV
jgi:transposase